jgi:hypothetical protein
VLPLAIAGNLAFISSEAMALELTKLDEHIKSLRDGNTLTENEVKALCDKVR